MQIEENNCAFKINIMMNKIDKLIDNGSLKIEEVLWSENLEIQ